MQATNAPKPELLIGIVNAIGADVTGVFSSIEDSLADVGYRSQVLRLIDELCALEDWTDQCKRESSFFERCNALMSAGNNFRKAVGKGEALVGLAIDAIRRIRTKNGKESTEPLPAFAYILRSLKHPDEVKALRAIYGNGFVLVGIYEPRADRVQHLAHKIAGSATMNPTPQDMLYAERLVARDEKEHGEPLGQDVRSTFPQADLFVDSSKPDEAREAVSRFVEILFGHPFHTPTRDEHAMFHAHAASLRSSALGKQVGAAIASTDGDLIAVGTNDVPKPGGGLFWDGDQGDRRDFKLDMDSNDEMKRQTLSEVLEGLLKEGLLDSAAAGEPIDQLTERCFKVLSGTRLVSLIEFGRPVHAEMNAIVSCASRGVPVKGTVIYSTTFPCHECGRHIITPGIRRVVYIEPYPKSLVAELHRGSIALERRDLCDEEQVLFEPFVGVAPRHYVDSFAMPRRKDDGGKPIKWTGRSAVPRFPLSPLSYLEREDAVLVDIGDHLESKSE